MIQILENSPYLPYIQLCMVAVFFFASYRSLEPSETNGQLKSPDKSPLKENQSEQNQSDPSQKPKELNSRKEQPAKSSGRYEVRQEKETTDYIQWKVNYTK